MSVPEAIALVEVATKATTAYHRPDLTARLGRTTERLKDPAVRVLVVGEFKQGKSQLVNSLVSAPVCPVDDDVATSVVTMRPPRRDTPSVALVRVGDGNGTPERTEVPLGELAAYVSEAGNPGNRSGLRHAEVGIPRTLLAGGLVLVDTPGVGGLGSAHGAATTAALAAADAVIMVSDAAQEYTRPELDFLAAAVRCARTSRACSPRPTSTRTGDASPSSTAAISRPPASPPTSSRCRRPSARWRCAPRASQLNEESGFPALIRYLREEVLARADQLDRRSTAHDVLDVCRQLSQRRCRPSCAAQESPERAAALLGRAGAGAGRRHPPQGPDRAVADHPQRRRGRPRGRHRARPARPAARGSPGGRGAGRRGRSRAGLGPVRRMGAPARSCVAASANFVRSTERARWLAVQRGADVRRGRRDRPARAGRGPRSHTPRVSAMQKPEISTQSVGERALAGLRGGYMGGLMLFMPLSLIAGVAVVAPFAAIGGRPRARPQAGARRARPGAAAPPATRPRA